jgi:hypothetical protein
VVASAWANGRRHIPEEAAGAQRGQAMTRRKGELTITRVKRDWPHHVELLAEKVKGNENSTTVNKFASALSVARNTTRS